MEFDCILFIAGYVLAFIGGFLIMLAIHLKTPEGTIVIEEWDDDGPDLFRFDMPLQLEELKAKKRIIFKVKVTKETRRNNGNSYNEEKSLK